MLVAGKLLLILLLLASVKGYSQSPRQVVKGKLVYGDYIINDVLIVNLSSQKEVRTDSLGDFTIAVKTGDTLVTDSYKIWPKRIVLTEGQLKENLLLIDVELKSYELEEIIIDATPKITSESLGLIPKGMKMPTVAERRLRAGTRDPVSAVVNVFSGKGKMLKMNVEIEKKETAFNTLGDLFEDSFFVDELKIAKEFVSGFKYYAVESKKIQDMLKSKDEGLIKFALTNLAVEYLKLLSDEK